MARFDYGMQLCTVLGTASLVQVLMSGMQKYRALFMRHLRAICDSPVHLTRESNEALLVRVGVDRPLYTLVSQTAERHRIIAAQEVFKVQPPALAELWSQVLASIRPVTKTRAPLRSRIGCHMMH